MNEHASLHDKVILCATDFSPCARLALDAATSLAWRTRSRTMHLLHVGPPVEQRVVEAMLNPRVARELDQAEEEASRQTHRLAEEVARESGLLVMSAFRCGHAAEEIVGYARAIKADYVVIGTHGREGIDRLLLGSVAQAVVRHAPCTVVVARANETA